DVGSTVRAIGYGFNTPSATGGAGAGTKRLVDITVNDVSAHEFSAGADLSGTCHGDSGGPIVQNGAIVGTTSYGTTAGCRGASAMMRVDDNRDFLDPYINGGGSGGGGGSDPNACPYPDGFTSCGQSGGDANILYVCSGGEWSFVSDCGAGACVGGGSGSDH